MDDQASRCRALIAAVVSLAISDWREAVAAKAKGRSYNSEPERWLRSDADRPMSFVWCCHALGFDPSAARMRLGLV